MRVWMRWAFAAAKPRMRATSNSSDRLKATSWVVSRGDVSRLPVETHLIQTSIRALPGCLFLCQPPPSSDLVRTAFRRQSRSLLPAFRSWFGNATRKLADVVPRLKRRYRASTMTSALRFFRRVSRARSSSRFQSRFPGLNHQLHAPIRSMMAQLCSLSILSKTP